MATYFPSPNNERDAAPMHYSYSETPAFTGSMMMYMNYASSSSGSYSDTLAGNSQQPNTCIDITPVGGSDSNVSHQEFLSNMGGSRVSEHDFSTWRDGRNEMLLMRPMGEPMGGPTSQNLQTQGLSLSLSPQIPSGMQYSSLEYRNLNQTFSSFLSPNASVSGEEIRRNGSFRENEASQSKQSRNIEYMQSDFSGNSLDLMKGEVSTFGMSNVARNIPNSKYLKAAQQLLDEVVNVRKSLKQKDCKKDSMQDPKVDDASKSGTSGPHAQDSTSNAPTELSAAEKQDLQNKMTKLLSMLDEVDRRYKQYFHQMQIVVSSFDVIAGCGAAKPYTALALQTISHHFRCLRDAINGQIRVTQRSLGDHDGSANSNGVGISRLRYVDQQLRQQRALQQLGMMQQHTWRPQRGLPESSVSVLRAWLFEHFLHPYPKDSDKIMLARQTGLTRSQVSNWFINARVRLWKPMVEEMYKEEAGDAELDSNSSLEVASKANKGDITIKTSEDRGEDLQNSATSTPTEKFFESKSSHVHDVEMVGPSLESGYEVRNPRGDERPSVTQYNAFPDFGTHHNFSLTLGLQHSEDGSIPMSVGNHHNFVTIRGDDVYDPADPNIGTDASVDFDCMDSGNRQQRFGSSQLLHDFVA